MQSKRISNKIWTMTEVRKKTEKNREEGRERNQTGKTQKRKDNRQRERGQTESWGGGVRSIGVEQQVRINPSTAPLTHTDTFRAWEEHCCAKLISY